MYGAVVLRAKPVQPVAVTFTGVVTLFTVNTIGWLYLGVLRLTLKLNPSVPPPQPTSTALTTQLVPTARPMRHVFAKKFIQNTSLKNPIGAMG